MHVAVTHAELHISSDNENVSQLAITVCIGWRPVQGCWKGEAVVRCFLGGPLHAELAAVQDLLHHSAPNAAAANASAARQASHAQLMGDLSRDENDSSDQGHVVSGHASSREDATCPICLVWCQDLCASAVFCRLWQALFTDTTRHVLPAWHISQPDTPSPAAPLTMPWAHAHHLALDLAGHPYACCSAGLILA